MKVSDSDSAFRSLVEVLRRSETEREDLEFKESGHGRGGSEGLGHRISAIANSLPLLGLERGYIVWGIHDQSHDVVGTAFRPRKEKVGAAELEIWLTSQLDPQPTLRFSEGTIDDKHVVVLEIGPALGRPVAFKNERFIRVNSVTKKLADCGAKECELFGVLARRGLEDWSAGVVDLGVEALDAAAMREARRQHSTKNPRLSPEAARWDDLKFLQKLKLADGGRLTRAAVILLGSPPSERALSPAVAKISWILRGSDDAVRDYAHFGPPFLTAADEVFKRIRNLTYRYMKEDGLFPAELTTYDPWVLREAFNNCIAHQDYVLASKINVVEREDEIVFTNAGAFIPRTVENALRVDAPPAFYRNRLLVDAMVHFNMIDSVGSGIRKMFEKQRQRRFPLPDYEFASGGVKVSITGRVIDESYTRALSDESIALDDVLLLDRVQRGRELSGAEYRRLRARGLIEGRRPNVFVSSTVARLTGAKAEYLKNRGLDKRFYKQLIVQFLEQFGESPKREIEGLLLEKLPGALTPVQRRTFLKNLLYEMSRKDGVVRTVGVRRGAKWTLARPSSEAGG